MNDVVRTIYLKRGNEIVEHADELVTRGDIFCPTYHVWGSVVHHTIETFFHAILSLYFTIQTFFFKIVINICTLQF